MRPSTLLAMVTLLSGPGAAAEEAAQAAADSVATPAPGVKPAAEEQAPAPPTPAAAPGRFSLRVATGIGVARGAANVSVGSGFDFTPRFNAGVEFEYSPWFDYLGGKAAPGTINAYLTASFRWLGTAAFEVRTGIFLGGSLLLFDTPGARGGSVGVILGTNVLRAQVRLSERWWFEISPDAVLVAPSLRGVPLVYPQFRLTGAMRVVL